MGRPPAPGTFTYENKAVICSKFYLLSPFGGEAIHLEFPKHMEVNGNQDYRRMALITPFYWVAKCFPCVRDIMEKRKLWGTVLRTMDLVKWAEFEEEDTEKLKKMKSKKPVEITEEFFSKLVNIVNLFASTFNKQLEADFLSPKSQKPCAELLHLIQRTVYNLASNNEVAAVKHKNVNDRSLTYGETSCRQFEKFATDGEEKKEHVYVSFTKDDVFLDMGSGFGHIVSYVAGRTKAKKVIGIELDKDLARRANIVEKWLRKLSKWFYVYYSPVEFIEGNFFDYEDEISKATIILVNNLVFQPELNEKLKILFSKLSPGVQIISTASFGDRRQTDKRVAGEIWCRDFKRTSMRNASWTLNHIQFYLQTVYYRDGYLPDAFTLHHVNAKITASDSDIESNADSNIRTNDDSDIESNADSNIQADDNFDMDNEQETEVACPKKIRCLKLKDLHSSPLKRLKNVSKTNRLVSRAARLEARKMAAQAQKEVQVDLRLSEPKEISQSIRNNIEVVQQRKASSTSEIVNRVRKIPHRKEKKMIESSSDSIDVQPPQPEALPSVEKESQVIDESLQLPQAERINETNVVLEPMEEEDLSSPLKKRRIIPSASEDSFSIAAKEVEQMEKQLKIARKTFRLLNQMTKMLAAKKKAIIDLRSHASNIHLLEQETPDNEASQIDNVTRQPSQNTNLKPPDKNLEAIKVSIESNSCTTADQPLLSASEQTSSQEPPFPEASIQSLQTPQIITIQHSPTTDDSMRCRNSSEAIERPASIPPLKVSAQPLRLVLIDDIYEPAAICETVPVPDSSVLESLEINATNQNPQETMDHSFDLVHSMPINDVPEQTEYISDSTLNEAEPQNQAVIKNDKIDSIMITLRFPRDKPTEQAEKIEPQTILKLVETTEGIQIEGHVLPHVDQFSICYQRNNPSSS